MKKTVKATFDVLEIFLDIVLTCMAAAAVKWFALLGLPVIAYDVYKTIKSAKE